MPYYCTTGPLLPLRDYPGYIKIRQAPVEVVHPCRGSARAYRRRAARSEPWRAANARAAELRRG